MTRVIPSWSKTGGELLLAVVRRLPGQARGAADTGTLIPILWLPLSNCSDPFWWMMNSFLCFQLEAGAGEARQGEQGVRPGWAGKTVIVCFVCNN